MGTRTFGTRGRRTSATATARPSSRVSGRPISAWRRHPSAGTWERFLYYGVDGAAKDLFVDGHCDMAIMLPTYLYAFYNKGFNTTEQCSALKDAYPEKVILAGRIDPREGTRGLEQLEADHERWKFRSVKIYTAEWFGDSKGYSLKEDSVGFYMEKCRALGIDIIHIHKGPTIHPLNIDAFDVRDVDDIATAFPDLKFVIDHCGIPRVDEFCWIANQEPNVYGGLSVVSAFIYARPRYFASLMADLLFFLGPDRLIFGTDYGIHSPKWIVEHFANFEFDDEMAREAGTQFTLDVKAKILGLNAARLYDIPVPAECYQPTDRGRRQPGGGVRSMSRAADTHLHPSRLAAHAASARTTRMAVRAKETDGGSTGQTLTARHPEVSGRSPGLEGRPLPASPRPGQRSTRCLIRNSTSRSLARIRRRSRRRRRCRLRHLPPADGVVLAELRLDHGRGHARRASPARLGPAGRYPPRRPFRRQEDQRRHRRRRRLCRDLRRGGRRRPVGAAGHVSGARPISVGWRR